jgi:hypothetical protein
MPYSEDWFEKLPEEVQKRYPKTKLILEIKMEEDAEKEEF